MDRYLAILEVSQKQAYIFGSNKVRDNIVNSTIIAYVLGEDYIEKVLSKFGYDKENEKFVRRAKIKMSGNIYSSRGLYIDDNLYVIGFDGNVIVLDMDNYNELLRFKMK